MVKAGHANYSSTKRYLGMAGVVFRDEAEALEAPAFFLPFLYRSKRISGDLVASKGAERSRIRALGRAQRKPALLGFVADELGEELDRLYELPPGEFAAARDEAAKRLRSEGRRELADEVKRFRKPTLAVWLVNCLARERALDVKRLLKAGEALAASQAGGSADEFAEARREEQHALERLAAAAAELAEREGAGPPAVERAVQTMRAASLGAEGRELLERGRLTEELEPPGFAALAGVPPARAKPKQKPKPKDDRGERRRALEAARERVKELRAEERERAQEAREATRAAERAEAEAGTLRRAAEEADAAVTTVAEARAAAEAELRALE